MNEDIIIAPIAIFMSLGVLPLIIMYFLNKIKSGRMEALIKVAELGGNIDDEQLKLLIGGAADHKADYRSGLIWLAIGIPLALGLWMAGGFQVAIFGSIPLFVGIAFIISGKYRLREPSK